MSYAGTYGADETCPHGYYWKSCRYCALIGPCPTEEQKEQKRLLQAERKARYLRHPDDVRAIIGTPRVITVYDATCSNGACEWKRHGVSKEQLDIDIAEHFTRACRTAAIWQGVNPDEAYVEP